LSNKPFYDVNVSLYGTTPSFITYTGSTGRIMVRTFTAAGVASSSYSFSFSAFAP
jgi:hypothetical protein